MILRRMRVFILFYLCIMPQAVFSGDFDGLKPLSGSVDKIKDSLVRKTSKINRAELIENKLILQVIDEGVENVDDSLAWSITISKKNRQGSSLGIG